MTLFRNFFSCVRGNRSHTHRSISSSQIKIKFGEPFHHQKNKECHLPQPIFKLITFLAHEGIQTKDLFRRPGNITQMNIIIKLLKQGKPVQWNKYNLYTCANVAKKYLLNLPGGLFGRKGESTLLATLDFTEEERVNVFLEVLRNMIPVAQELTILLFGILFRMVTHSINVHQTVTNVTPPESAQNLTDQINGSSLSQMNYSRSISEQTIDSQNLNNRQSILAEAVAKSVAGSLFHTCRDSPDEVERAAKVLESLILAFPSFDSEFIDFFDQSMTKMSHSSSSTLSSRDLSISGSLTIVRKPSGLAASLELWSEKFGKNSSQRNSLKDPDTHRHEKLEFDSKKVPHVLFHNVPINIPIITITNPFGEINTPNFGSSFGKGYQLNERDVKSSKVSDVTSFRHFQTRLQSMKRRHQDNLKKRSDWFLNNSPTPTLPAFNNENDFSSIVVVTCGGSSICLGQTQTTVSGNKCLLLNANNSTLMSNYFASSGPDMLQNSPCESRPDTPDYSIMSQEMDYENYCYSLTTSNVQIYCDNNMENDDILSSNIDQDLSQNVEAPNSVPLIRRMLPSRSSTNSRKTSIQPESNFPRYISSGNQEEEEEEDDEGYIIEDTQSDC